MAHFNNPSPMPSNIAPPRLSGAKSHIFQPPRTRSDSASSSLILTRSTNSITTSTSSARPHLAPGKRSRAMDDEDGAMDRCPGSPQPLVNTKYVLAGGMDTPTMRALQLGESEYGDASYRKQLDGDMHETRRGLFSDLDGPLPPDGRQGNGRPVGWDSPTTNGWGKAVLGKIWQWGGAVFRGFHAGGGQGYTLNTNTESNPYQVEEPSFWETEKNFSTWGPPDRESTPVPGRFPEEEFIPNYLDQRPTPEARPSKRRQVSRNNTQNEELAKNWVVVPPPATENITPSRPQPRAGGAARYSMPTTSSSGRRSTAPARPASRAGTAPRRPMLSRVSHAGSPALTPSRGASFASARSSPNSKIPRPSTPMQSLNKTMESPAAKEAQRWVAQKKQEEREADESMRRLERQLKAMIREGKEALGTRVEVEMDYEE
ncbi:hypothetical protein LHYA1_G007070 [Lachnellula hyalina]|uniref:Uncharacterized protein n=1 Tax=Lachnellula hyalina TaxID=1316788 RepID=A0A8H8QXD4_9HELO|nr:uncharacterized protein LHYA1_G007070 [Lachnellula hyalina]TVY24494.1 hypothetical protein LHYA1_G007070 [Lachnellula hyalina]